MSSFILFIVSAKWARCLKLLALLAWNGVSTKSQIQQKLTYELKKQTNKEKVTKKNRPTIINQLGGRAPVCFV